MLPELDLYYADMIDAAQPPTTASTERDSQDKDLPYGIIGVDCSPRAGACSIDSKFSNRSLGCTLSVILNDPV